ncbi:MAG: hypothetical protein KQH83_08520 [Actinobacteria bacterium]|nr:hypothetical protein [Actinomycetota bacterium]
MRSRAAAAVVTLALVASSCASGDVDRLATDTCAVLEAYRSGGVTAAEVEAEFEEIVRRAESSGTSVDLIESQVEVQCFDALHDYLARGDG